MTNSAKYGSNPQMVQYPEHQIQIDRGLSYVSASQYWLSPGEIGELVQPFKKIESQRINIKKQTGWYGRSHTGSRIVTPENRMPVLGIMRLLGVTSTRNVLTQHSSDWDAQSVPYSGDIWQCVLESTEGNGETDGRPIASLLIHDPFGPKNTLKQRLSLGTDSGYESTQWSKPDPWPWSVIGGSAVAQMLKNSRNVNTDCTIPLLK